VAIARQMLVVVWHAWHNAEVDQHTDTLAIARKLMTWAEQGGKAMQSTLTATQFVRLQLDRLGIGHELTELHNGSHAYALPPTERLRLAALILEVLPYISFRDTIGSCISSLGN
jgi:hypothetical protein